MENPAVYARFSGYLLGLYENGDGLSFFYRIAEFLLLVLVLNLAPSLDLVSGKL